MAATVLAVVLAMEIDFSKVPLMAAGAYAVGRLSLLTAPRRHEASVPLMHPL